MSPSPSELAVLRTALPEQYDVDLNRSIRGRRQLMPRRASVRVVCGRRTTVNSSADDALKSVIEAYRVSLPSWLQYESQMQTMNLTAL